MDNKLSELKAAAMAATPGPWISGDDSWSDGDNANISTEERYDSGIINIAQVDGGGSESGFDEPFSTEQQANAAFIAAANPAVVLALLAELEAKDKRIAELSRLLAHNIERAEAAEKRLATPVRLPNKNDAEFWFGSTFQVAKFDRAVERAISAAGFKFVGDE
ncbi:ead/Ea22-like family protein [Serratia marcescens]|uniref:ead/Ea22-like family protein n=1 Tax=Serratia marcescens TaxID=615 RepID=UPI0036F544C8